MGTTIVYEFLILHTLNNLPSDYDNIVENLEERVDLVINPLGIEDVCQKMSEKFEEIRLRKKVKEDTDDKEEQALFTTKFKGRCNKCGKFGHKAKVCRSNVDKIDQQENKKKFTGKCFHCGKVEHCEADCWAKHGKPNDKANTAEDKSSNDDDIDSNDDAVLISIEDIAGVDFAGISF